MAKLQTASTFVTKTLRVYAGPKTIMRRSPQVFGPTHGWSAWTIESNCPRTVRGSTIDLKQVKFLYADEKTREPMGLYSTVQHNSLIEQGYTHLDLGFMLALWRQLHLGRQPKLKVGLRLGSIRIGFEGTYLINDGGDKYYPGLWLDSGLWYWETIAAEGASRGNKNRYLSAVI